MKNVQKIDLGLTGYDELFANDEERKVNKLPRIFDIPISEIDDFPDHPFKVKIDEDMDQLVQSIKERGIITPVTLRPKEDGRYEIVSGHRRKKACELAGLDTVKAEVREMSRDEAIILMVESNLQRSTILPSEKAFSYKMRLEAMKRQAGRPAQDNYSPVGNNSLGTKSSEIMADEVGESRNTIFRYIRLTELIPPLLDLVDEGRIAFRPAVELSYECLCICLIQGLFGRSALVLICSLSVEAHSILRGYLCRHPVRIQSYRRAWREELLLQQQSSLCSQA